jgi:hypothetical protein
VDTFSLDYLFGNGQIPQVDFLSIDTQGAELLILKGGVDVLQRHTVAVQCEINFCELYKGLALFGELDAFMQSHDFVLAQIVTFDMGFHRIPRAFRSKGMPLQGEALYFLRPDAIQEEEKNINRLEKLAFAAVAFGFTELASQAIERARHLFEMDQEPRLYQIFLNEFATELKRDTSLPPLWHEEYSFEKRIQRFALQRHSERSLLSLIIERFRSDPKAFQKVILSMQTRLKNITKRALSCMPFSISFKSQRSSFESFLTNNGFKNAAREVGIRRERDGV